MAVPIAYSTNSIDTLLDTSSICLKDEMHPDKAPQQVLVTWKEINAFAPNINLGKCNCCRPCCKTQDQTNRQILNSVSGMAKPGELLAIMGVSGTGKTTLLNVLTMNLSRAVTVTGQVFFNHQPVTNTMLAATSAYVQQDDLFIGALTVKEQIIFQAMLRMDGQFSYKQRVLRVEEVISELGLIQCQDTLIGIPGRIKGISGGEKRRLSMACEVLTNPPVMFCDEPTSGLDSFMAQNVLGLLKNLAAKGKTIICTIHQPSSQLYNLFDKIMFLAEGRVAYLGTKEGALDFFSQLNFHCPLNFNPADFFIHSLAIIADENEEKRATVAKICETFEQSPEFGLIANEIKNCSATENSKQQFTKRIKSPYEANWHNQFRALIWRSYLSVIREPLLIRIRILQTLLVAGFFGFFFWHQDLSQKSVSNINGAFYILMISQTFQNVFAVVNVFCSELPIFLREHHIALYRSEIYFLCKTLADQPIFIFIPVLLSTIVYWMIGFHPDPIKFLIFTLIFTLVINAATSYGYFISAVSPTITMALSLGSTSVLPLLLFGGFFISKRTVPWYFDWIQYISWFKYGYEALSINQWKDVTHIECNVNNITCPKNGLVILQLSDFKPNELFFNVGMLAALVLGIRLVAFLAFTWRASRKL